MLASLFALAKRKTAGKGMSNLEKSESVTSVFTEYRCSLRKMISRYLSRKSDVEDVLQETFARTYAADKKKSVQFPKLYLFKTAKHLVFNENTKVTNMLTEYLEDTAQIEHPGSTISPLDSLSHAEEKALLQRAIENLPTQCKRVTALRLNNDFAVKDIADELNLSLSTVEKHLAKGIERCDSYMREYVSECQSIKSEEKMPIKRKGSF